MAPPDVEDPRLIYRMPAASRRLALALAIALSVFLLALAPQWLRSENTPAGRVFLEAVWLVLAVLVAMLALTARTAFLFGIAGVVSRQWWGSRSLAFADMSGCTVHPETQMNGRGPIARGWRVTFLPADPAVRPLTLFVDERVPLDPCILARLRSIAVLDERALKVLGLATLDKSARP